MTTIKQFRNLKNLLIVGIEFTKYFMLMQILSAGFSFLLVNRFFSRSFIIEENIRKFTQATCWCRSQHVLEHFVLEVGSFNL